MVRVPRSAACAIVPTWVMAALVVIAHCVSAGIVAVWAVNFTAAWACVEAAATAVQVVEEQPDVVGFSVPASVHPGRVMVIVSPGAISLLMAKVDVTALALPR